MHYLYGRKKTHQITLLVVVNIGYVKCLLQQILTQCDIVQIKKMYSVHIFCDEKIS